MMEKDWVNLNRATREYGRGAWNFVHAAKRKLGDVEKISCPCLNCKNLSRHHDETVVEHLIIKGMDPTYKKSSRWYFHGEQVDVAKKIKLDNTYDPLKAILYEDLKKQRVDHSISRAQVCIKSHTRKNGDTASTTVADTIEKMKKIESGSQPSLVTNYREDALSKVLGQDKPGRMRATGRGMTYFKEFLAQVKNKQMVEMQGRISELEVMIHTLINHQSKDEKLCDKCDLLDWCGTDEIVAEGRVVSSDPRELVQNIPLGTDAMKILIDFPKKHDAFLWRPSLSLTRVGDVQGEIVAWPSSRVVKRMISQSEREENESKTSSTYRKCELYDWTGSEDLVAEGRLYSSDPKHFVHDIPLGPSAMAVWIDDPKKRDAFLWRPAAGMIRVGEAVGLQVAWLESKVVMLGKNTPPWRPSSGLEHLEDAVGTTIAWPAANVKAESTSSN